MMSRLRCRSAECRTSTDRSHGKMADSSGNEKMGDDVVGASLSLSMESTWPEVQSRASKREAASTRPFSGSKAVLNRFNPAPGVCERCGG